MGTMTTTTKKAAAPKQPQDRRPKTAKVDGKDALSIEFRGVPLTVPLTVLDDFELLDDLDALDQGDVTRLARLLRRVAGDKYRELVDTARDDNGHVSIEAGGDLVAELLAALDPNSFGSRAS